MRIARYRRRVGYTLVEVLAVTALIAFLVGLLVPLASRSREIARRVKCLSNLRQMVQAANQYAAQNDGVYPSAWYPVSTMSSHTDVCWDITTVTPTHQPSRASAGLLWSGQTSIEIQQCPSFDGKANWDVDPFTGYNYNTSFVGSVSGQKPKALSRVSLVTHPSRTALFGDGQYAGGANKFMIAPFGGTDQPPPWSGTQGFRHLNQTNAAFADGHAESFSTRYTANRSGASHVAIGTGFLSPDNSLYGGN